MANRCVSLDATWAHLPAPAHPTWLSPVGASFEDEALTVALWASMSPPAGAAATDSSSYCSVSPTPSSSTTTTSSASAEILAAASSARVPTRVGPIGRVSKRKPRPSRRARTTYISADPADFRRMVQEITGYHVPGADTAFAAASSTPAPWPAAAPACVLPTLDTSAFLLDCASPPPLPQPERKSKNAVVSPTMAAFPAAADEASSLLQELEAMVTAPPAFASAFPTLESWGII